MNRKISSHEENADEVVELLKLLNIENVMVGGHSTGEISSYEVSDQDSL